MTEKMFEKAARMKLRFPYKGMCSVEDLWDMTLTSLDGLYKTLRAKQKETEGDSLLDTKSSEDKTLALQIELVKYIVAVKQEENAAKKSEAERKMQVAQLSDILARKKNAELENLPLEELEKKIAELTK